MKPPTISADTRRLPQPVRQPLARPHADTADLLERETQLALLHQCLARVRPGARGGCVLVHGEAGCGKTALVQQFLASIDVRAGQTLVTGCEALIAPRPLGPLVDLGSFLPPAVARALHDGQLWSGLFPSLLTWLRDQRPPTVLVIEDMHWADAGTLDFVRYTGRRLNDVGALLVLTYRSDELDAGHALRPLLGELPPVTTTRVPVPALSPQAVATLAQRAHQSRRGLYEATGGNPFYVTEVLSSRSEGVPPSVSDAVLGRLAQLPACGRAAAEQASVFPNQVTRAVLERVMPGCGEGIDYGLQIGLLVTRGDALAFRHELAREAVLGSLLPHRRAALHAAALAVLRDDRSEDALARQVHHAQGAGLTDEVARLAPHAARYAAANGAQHEAAHLYALALQHGAHAGAERARLLEDQARACLLINRHEDATAAVREALQLRRALGDAHGEAFNLNRLSHLHMLLADSAAAAFACTRQAIEVLAALPPERELAIAYSTLSYLHLVCLDVDAALAFGRKAIDLAESLGDAGALTHALNTVGVARLRIRDDPEGWALLQRSLDLALEHRFDTDAARAHNNRYIMAVCHHDLARAATFAQQGIVFCEAKGIDLFAVRLRIRVAFAHMQAGEWSAADAQLAVVAGRHALSPMEAVTRDLVQHLLDLRRGRAHARRQVEATLASMQALGVRIWFTSIEAVRAELAWLDDEPGAAGIVRAQVTAAVDAADAWKAGELAAWLVRLGAHLPAPVEAIALPHAQESAGRVRDAAAEWARLGYPYERAIVLAGGDEADQREALAEFERLGADPAAELLRRRLRRLGITGVARGPQPRTRRDPLGLTARERQVFDLLQQGASNAAIADRLHRSIRTVENHVASVLAKTGASSRAELIAVSMSTIHAAADK